jgi:ABC-type Fe3+-hydroxamate transport system substrate-binding protein
LKNIRFLVAVITVIALLFAFSGCALKKEKGFPVTVGGTEISEPPKTVATLSEQAASSICALGYKSYLVGAPSEFLTTDMPGVTDLGPSMDIDHEALYKLAPDVLIVPGELLESIQENLNSRNIKTVLLKTPTTYNEIAPYYEALSKLFLGSEKYKEAYDPYITESERIISDVKKSLNGVNKKVLLYIEEGFVATGDTIAGQAMQKAGMINIAAEETNYMMSFADIKNANPDIIFCAKGSSKIFLESESYADLTAVKNGAVYEVDANALVYASEGFAATLQSMSKYILQ